jgi:inosine/xanthosine triphosphatase
MIIAVGSTNPTKIRPVRAVFKKHFKNVIVKGIAVESGVRDQPMNDNDMYKGALMRAKEAVKNVKGAVYGVGIEGGINRYSYGWFERSIVIIVNTKGNIGIGASGGLALPKKVIKKIQKGKNLEEAVDELFGTKNIGEGIGMFGVFTNGTVTRSSGIAHGVAFALARFLHEEVYG